MKRKYTQDEVYQNMTGRLYCNSDDANIIVRRKGSLSWTMNLGNAWSWVIIVLEIFIVATIILVML